MVNKKIIDTSLEIASQWGKAEYMPEGLILTDCIADGPNPTEPKRMSYITMALCRNLRKHCRRITVTKRGGYEI